jgi:hypothetical protein
VSLLIHITAVPTGTAVTAGSKVDEAFAAAVFGMVIT